MCHNSIINKYINRIIFSLVKICYRFMKEIISLTVKAQQSKCFKIRPGHPILTKSFVSCCPYIFFSPNFKTLALTVLAEKKITDRQIPTRTNG